MGASSVQNLLTSSSVDAGGSSMRPPLSFRSTPQFVTEQRSREKSNGNGNSRRRSLVIKSVAASLHRGGEETPTKLYKMILKHDWSAARERLERRPDEASVWTRTPYAAAAASEDNDEDKPSMPSRRPSDAHRPKLKKGSYRASGGGDDVSENEYGCRRLPLHRACASKPPVELVDALIESYPDGVRCREKFGMLPLHVACQRGASPRVVESLVQSYPPAARERDAFGLLPIHLACTEGCSIDSLRALLRSYPGGAEETDDTGMRPADYVRESMLPNRDAAMRELGRDPNYWSAAARTAAEGKRRESHKIPGGGSSVAVAFTGLYCSVARMNWEQALTLLSADPSEAGIWVVDSDAGKGNAASAAALDVSPRPQLPLHAACARRAPAKVVFALMDAHPPSVSSAGGSLDLLPLHIACQSGCQAETVQVLADAYPQGAYWPDGFGLLPIHLAITEGASGEVVKVLLRAFPAGTKVKDRKGHTPMEYARASLHPNREEILELLGRDPESWSTAAVSVSSSVSNPTKAADSPSVSKNDTAEGTTTMANLDRLVERVIYVCACKAL